MEVIRELFEEHAIPFKEEDITPSIINLFQKNEIDTTITNDKYYNYVGLYHQLITENCIEMEKYYLMAIEKGNSDAMVGMGLYYEEEENNYTEMEKYYLMAIENGNSNAMNNLGYYHFKVTKNYSEMEKYLLMAIENGNKYAMNSLGFYHNEVTKNYSEMEKYYLMAIENDCSEAMFNYGSYHDEVTKNYTEMEKYYLMAIEKGDDDAMCYFGEYHRKVTKNYTEMEKYYLMAIENGHCELANHLLDMILPMRQKGRYYKIHDYIIRIFLKTKNYEVVVRILKIYKSTLTPSVYEIIYPYIKYLNISENLKEKVCSYNIQKREQQLSVLQRDIPWDIRNRIKYY